MNANPRQDVLDFIARLDFRDDAELQDYVVNVHLNRFAETLPFIPPGHGGALLEIGARTPTLAYCRAVLKYEQVEGTRATWETSMRESISDLSGKRYDFAFHTFDLGLNVVFPLPDATYDTVVCTEVIEHITFDPGKGLLDQIARVLKKGGTLVLSTPNITSLDAFMRMCSNNTPLIHPIFTDVGWLEHPKEYSPLELKATVEKSGFRVERITTIVEPYEKGSAMDRLHEYLKGTNYSFELSRLFTLIVAKR